MGQGNDSWLDNDPEWDALRRRLDKRPLQKPSRHAKKQSRHTSTNQAPKPSIAPPEAPEAPKKVEVSLNLTLPKLRLTKLPKPNPRQLKVGVACAAIIGVSILGSRLLMNNKSDKAASDPNNVLSDTTQPRFDTLSPEGKGVDGQGGFKKISPPENAPVFAFIDRIDGNNIRVSQQELPPDFKENPDDNIAKLAESFSATEVINVSNPKAYLGTNARGPQTVIFHKKGLLVIINSDKSIDKDRWAEYITKLL